jgi:hypothetical protein
VPVSLGPLAPSLVTAVLHPATLNDLLDEKKYSILGDYAGILVEDRVLESPTAIFQGLNRPLHSDGIDRFVFIYCSKPKRGYCFTGMNRPADQLVPPSNSMFATYLTLNRPMVDEVRSSLLSSPGEFRGIILGWEWIPESPIHSGLPVDYDTRYIRRMRWPG